ncbi:hypothetical protein OM076_08675 [Solirubrobacter ginsenosidimutans]|uniref:Uncharacterized protein n=1 Tax=Solirubrobacter ginsenosidimutans TaxID=490573 RepID=A0A9X3S1Q4_9ACTN|nr:hypothetical protein [Solirubrobacter ginsenosidimutans]MDA0160336.1 hypothetical protein [Solirubrobacter ginsenosidimutans]
MKRSRIALAVGLASAGMALCTSVAAAATVQTATQVAPLSGCSQPVMTQPFAFAKDFNAYTLAPGGTFDSAVSAGWELKSGAGIVQTAQPDGTVGGSLDLPSKSQATSPVLCVTSDYPTARLHVRNLAGSEGVFFYVSYWNNGVWTAPKNTGQFHGSGNSLWTLSNPMNVQPSGAAGWQQVRFTFVAGGNTSRFQVDNFWVDPRISH